MYTYEQLKSMRKSKVLQILESMGVRNISPDGKYSISAIAPGNGDRVGLYDPRDLVMELQRATPDASPAPLEDCAATPDASPAPMGIDEQLRIWRENTPVWECFPLENQSAVYFLGLDGEYCDPLEQPRGAIVVFNSRRGTVRAYPRNYRNYSRFCRMAMLGTYAYIGNRISPNCAFGDEQPRGIVIPSYNAVWFTKRGIVVCNNRVWGYISDFSSAYATIEGKFYSATRSRLVGCKFTQKLWDSQLEYCPIDPAPLEDCADTTPDASPDTTPAPIDPRLLEEMGSTGLLSSHEIRSRFAGLGYVESAQIATIEWRGGLMGFHWYITIPRSNGIAPVEMYFCEGDQLFHMVGGLLPNPTPRDLGESVVYEQIPYDPALEDFTVVSFDDFPGVDDGLTIPAPAPAPLEDFTGFGLGLLPSQGIELGEQLAYWRDQLDLALGGNNWERINLCNQWIYALEGVVCALIVDELDCCLGIVDKLSAQFPAPVV